MGNAGLLPSAVRIVHTRMFHNYGSEYNPPQNEVTSAMTYLYSPSEVSNICIRWGSLEKTHLNRE